VTANIHLDVDNQPTPKKRKRALNSFILELINKL